MIYVLICLLLIQSVLVFILINKYKKLINKMEDIKLDLQICISKAEQIYRNFEVLNSKLEDVVRRIK